MHHETDNYSENNVYIIKGRFKANSLNLYGQFMVIFNPEKQFESYNAVVSTYSDLYDLEPHEEWIKYNDTIAAIKWKGNYNAHMTKSLMDQFKKFSEEMNSVSLLFDNVFEYDYKTMDITLFDLIKRIVHDKNLIMETGIQEVLPSEFKEAKKNLNKPDDKGPESKETPEPAYEGYSLEEGSVILPVKPILAPVKGKPIYELHVGDRLMINIIPNSDRSNYFIDLLDLREDGKIKPAPAEVIDIKAVGGRSGSVDILTLIASGLYGKFTEEEKQVKLRIYNPATDGPLYKKRSEVISKEDAVPLESMNKLSFSKGTIIMLVLFILILTLFIALIIISL